MDAQQHREPVLDRIGQLFCGLHGHDELLEFEGSRMFLRCVNCGHQSPGWDVSDRLPTDTGPEPAAPGKPVHHERRAA